MGDAVLAPDVIIHADWTHKHFAGKLHCLPTTSNRAGVRANGGWHERVLPARRSYHRAKYSLRWPMSSSPLRPTP